MEENLTHSVKLFVLKLTGHINYVFKGWKLTLALILVKLDKEQGVDMSKTATLVLIKFTEPAGTG